jgi:hypothetical protein
MENEFIELSEGRLMNRRFIVSAEVHLDDNQLIAAATVRLTVDAHAVMLGRSDAMTLWYSLTEPPAGVYCARVGCIALRSTGHTRCDFHREHWKNEAQGAD